MLIQPKETSYKVGDDTKKTKLCYDLSFNIAKFGYIPILFDIILHMLLCFN